MKRIALFTFALLAAGSFDGAAAAEPAQPAVPARTEINAMDAWEVNCAYDKDNRKLGCSAVLRVTQPASQASATEPARPERVFMVWALSKANDGAVYSSFQTLTGIRVQPGLQLKLDAAAPRMVPFDSCGTTTCVAIAPMDSDFLRQARSATQIQATVQGADGRAYTATFVPKGIDRAIAAVL
jgi:invasion protein IalB